RLEYEICGWSDGEECWAIQKAEIFGKPNKLETWAQLDEIIDREYHRADNSALKIARTFIDSGYSTENVYAYCRSRMSRGRFPIKGYGAFGIPLIHKFTKVDDVMLVILGVNNGKQEVFNRLGLETPGKLYFHYPLEDNLLGGRGYDQFILSNSSLSITW
ncbi:MAG: phage terminase large subunit family protein, partial [Selenomonadaceae bacterium]|nr:phage terminase large subunit family protein [Selenomonadaceae bacterium]